MLPDLRTPVPGPESLALADELRRYESRNVTFTSADFPIFWDRAEGTNVWDVDGNRFLDFTAGFAVTGLGHGAAAIRAAAHAQLDRLGHAMGDVHPGRGKVELCRRLSEITFERWGLGTGRTILGSSGSEAVEAALKTALLHTGRSGVLSFDGAYHGLGHGALAAGGLEYFRAPFEAQLARFGVRVPFPAGPSADLAPIAEAIRAALRDHEIGAILVEPIQGRGGEVVPPGGFLSILRSAADDHGAVLIFDEIYTGFNRTGALFACDRVGVAPDLICLGKGLTSGFPLSACVGASGIMDAWPESTGEALHTSTYLGHPVGCAMALAAIAEHLRPETAAAVASASGAFDRAFAAIDSERIGGFRGAGLLRGIEIVRPDGSADGALAGELVTGLLERGLLILAGGPLGHVVSLTPPFAISEAEIRFFAETLQEYVTSRPGSISKSTASRSVV
jgi:4-aminobutyrate aminotransferase-like enzyme